MRELAWGACAHTGSYNSRRSDSNATGTPMPPPTVIPIVTPTPTATNVVIDCIFFDGLVSRTEADEYVQITNRGAAPKT